MGEAEPVSRFVQRATGDADETAVVLVAAAVVAIATGASAQSYQFQRIVSILRQAGYIHEVDTGRGWLRDQESQTFSIGLAAGVTRSLPAAEKPAH